MCVFILLSYLIDSLVKNRLGRWRACSLRSLKVWLHCFLTSQVAIEKAIHILFSLWLTWFLRAGIVFVLSPSPSCAGLVVRCFMTTCFGAGLSLSAAPGSDMCAETHQWCRSVLKNSCFLMIFIYFVLSFWNIYQSVNISSTSLF